MRQVLALLATCLLAAGCGGDQDIAGGGVILGETLTVASMLPFDEPDTRDLVAGQKLALYEAGGRVGEYGVNFVSHDDGVEDPAGVARRVIHDSQVVAIVGEARETTLPVTNAAGILHVVPGAGPAESDPRLSPSGRRTVFVGGEAVGGSPDFAAEFRRFFGRDPGPRALSGYVAMRGVLEALRAAGAQASRRSAVIEAFSRRSEAP